MGGIVTKQHPPQIIYEKVFPSQNCKGKAKYYFTQQAAYGQNEGVAIKKTQKLNYPYCAIVKINATINGLAKNSTGFFIAPNIVMTTAHSFSERKNGQTIYHRAAKVTVTVLLGQNKQIEYDTQYYWYHPNYQSFQIQGFHNQYDYGIVVLKQNLDYGYFGIVENSNNFSKQQMTMMMAYPYEKKHDEIMRKFEGKIQKSEGPFFYYRFDTYNGTSGCPIYVKIGQDNFQVVGIHIGTVSGDKNYNRALKFTKQMRQLINQKAPKYLRRQIFIKQQIKNGNIDAVIKRVRGKENQISKLIIADSEGNLKLQLKQTGFFQLSNRFYFYNLKVLTFANNNINAIPQLGSGFQNVIQLNISKNPIKKIQNLEAMPQIETLYFNHNQISKIQNLTPLKKLKRLTIINNQIKTIENIEGLEKLQYLNLKNNIIYDLKNLQVILGLREKDKQYKNQIKVDLCRNPIVLGITNNKQYQKTLISNLKQKSISISCY